MEIKVGFYRTRNGSIAEVLKVYPDGYMSDCNLCIGMYLSKGEGESQYYWTPSCWYKDGNVTSCKFDRDLVFYLGTLNKELPNE